MDTSNDANIGMLCKSTGETLIWPSLLKSNACAQRGLPFLHLHLTPYMDTTPGLSAYTLLSLLIYYVCSSSRHETRMFLSLSAIQ